ncbi:MAG: undecaprenyl-diphosphate phosphatase [Candidatus Pacebacteria bacterium]|nr:undecaprenyl-diphosphate phosphatase [Candidatus Paceibacterota bacterium]
MNIWQALILGSLQGVTEFLPVSSSGHLALAQNWFGLTEPLVAFDVFLHVMSLIAIVIFFFAEIKKLNLKQLIMLGVATIPAVIVGLVFKDVLESIFSLTTLVGLALITTGIDNLISNKLLKNSYQEKEITLKNAVIIGIFQSVALIPGISRSGTTLLGSLSQKLEKKQAFNFTFLLAIPAITGATLLQTLDLFTGQTEIPALPLLVAGGLATLVTSLASLGIMKKLIKEAQFLPFGIYAIGLGLFVVLQALI